MFDGLTWNEYSFHGSWISGETAGGCPEPDPELDPEENTFLINPRLPIELMDSDDDDEYCTMIVSLAQKCLDRDFKAKIG